MKFIQLADQDYYLRQGDLDGACGPYAVIMALLALGVVERTNLDEYVYGQMDGRTRLGKIFSYYDNFNKRFFNDGTCLSDLVNALNKSYSQQISVSTFGDGGFRQKIEFIQRSIGRGDAIIMMINLEGYSHWVVCVGYQDANVITRLCLLDSGENSSCHRYNAKIEFTNRRKNPVCLYQGSSREKKRCQIEEAIFSMCWTGAKIDANYE
ncbi:hypothetical protein [Solidesulfovibrio alcoholivorans]|uniref:hypothetical protein n=1 Tax=Solidesulfovibrio alcoholivorans TaxID=81406 RepID=UPI000A0146CF|nr:hypothetical protein [Solidesulfovibrio alcoholivorans]